MSGALKPDGRLLAFPTPNRFFLLLFLLVLSVPVRLPAETSGKDKQNDAASFRVVDASGRAVVLPTAPRRIVVVGRGPYMALHLLYMFPEGRRRLVAYEEKLKGSNTFLPLLDARFHQKIALATNPGPEQVAAMDPDLVIMKGTTPMPLGGALAALGIPVVYLGMENPDMFARDTINLGILLGNRKRARQILEFYQSRLDLLEERLKGLKEEEKPGVLVVEYSDRGGKTAVRVPARSWIQTIQALTAGGRPVWLETAYGTDGWTITNFEQIAVWDPDKIFVIVWFTLNPGKVISSLHADPRWRMLKSVRNHELHAFPSDIFGWVGLIVPHIVRRVLGSDAQRVLPASMLLGGCFVLLCDDIARTLLSGEIPLGILTSLSGAAIFLVLLTRNQMKVER